MKEVREGRMIREESRCEKEEGKHTDFFKDRTIADSINKTMKGAGQRDALVWVDQWWAVGSWQMERNICEATIL